MEDHPESEVTPNPKKLRKGGYLQVAKTLALKETYQEGKSKRPRANPTRKRINLTKLLQFKKESLTVFQRESARAVSTQVF